MHPQRKSRQSREFAAFRCIGAACEDTCCADWGVSVDRGTYDKYQACGDPEMGPSLHQFVTINSAKESDEDFARIALVENRCPLLDEGLCSIQQKLGEAYLSNTCSSYPRMVIVVDGTEERSLHLSCPEAARLILLNPAPCEWKEHTLDPGESDDGKVRDESILVLSSQASNSQGTPYPCFHEVRSLFLQALQLPGHERWQRLAILAQLTEELNAILEIDNSSGRQAEHTAEFVARSSAALQSGAFPASPPPCDPPPLQIEVILELIVARIGSDFTAPRFLECYRDFMQGLRWGPETTMEELHSRYADARVRHYAPFIFRHEYLLDNFLANYAMRTVFPYGHREIGQRLQLEYVENVVRRQYLLLAAHYAALRGVLTGMAALHGAAFGVEHVIKLVQSYAKAFLHSRSFPEKALQILSGHGIRRATEAATIVQ